ncbi:MAG: hypothetical protein IJX31_00305 [Clostridia bacterium]|nr:hypothetical protein [Clostridia bacterium]
MSEVKTETQETEVKQKKKVKKEKEFKVPSRKKPIYKVVQLFLRLLYKKPQIINLAGELADKSIVVANHSAKSGPPALDMYYPKFTTKWGAHEMLGNYSSRKAYLRDILYIKKCGKKPGFATSFKAGFMAFFSLRIYRGMRIMPTYQDGRFATTLRNSVKVLDANMSVMIYPENSNEGYQDVLTEFFPGFVMLAEKYYRQKGEDVPVYPVYYSIKKRIMVIGKPLYVQDMVKEGLDRYQIAQRYCDAVNQLYFDYVQNVSNKRKKKKKSEEKSE